MLFVDHQTGLSNGVQDQSYPEYVTALTALAETAKAFGLPSVITTSAEDGPNGPILPVLAELLPQAPIVSRPGEINVHIYMPVESPTNEIQRLRRNR